MAQRLIGYSQARRIPTAADFEALIGEVLHPEAQALDAGKPYPFYLAQSWSRPLADMLPTLGPPSDWTVEWLPDGIRALLGRGENWRLLVARRRAHFRRLSRSRVRWRMRCWAAVRSTAELVVLIPPEGEFVLDSGARRPRPVCELQQRLGCKVVSEKTLRELPVAFIAYDLLEIDGRDIRAERARAASFARRADCPAVRRGESAGEPPAAQDQSEGRRGHVGRTGDEAAAGALAIARGADAEGARGRLRDRPARATTAPTSGGNGARSDASVDAVLIYAERGHGRRSGVFTDYTRCLERGRGRRASWCRSLRLIRGCPTRKFVRWTQSSAAPRSRLSVRCGASRPPRSSSLAPRALPRARAK